MTTNHEQPSMPDEPKQQGRQTIFRESDARIVPMQSECQSECDKPGNTGAGRAPRISRDSDRAPSVLRDGTAVIIRLGRSHTFATGVLERMPSFPPRVHRRMVQRWLGVPGLFVEVR